MAGGLSANERRIVELVLKATGDADLKRMVAELKATRTAAEGAQKSLGGIGAGLSAAGKFASGFIGALGVQQIIGWGRAILDAADALDAAAEQAGIGVERYQSLKQAFRTLEVDAKEFTTGMEKLGNVLSEVLAGEASKQVIASLKNLGVYSKILSGEVHDVEGFVDALAASQKALNNDLTVTSDLIPLVGAKLAGDYSSALRSGALLTEELRVQQEKYGVVSERELETLAEASETVEQAYNTVSNAILITTANTIEGIKKYARALSNRNLAEVILGLDHDKRQDQIDSATGGSAALARALSGLPHAAPVIPTHPSAGGGSSGPSAAQREAQRAQEAATKAYEDQLEREEELIRDVIKAQDDAAKAATDWAFALERAADPMIDFNAQMDKLNAAFELGKISPEAYATAVRALESDLDSLKTQLWENTDAFKENQKALEAQREHARMVREQWEYLADIVGQATYDIISGTESITQAVKKMVGAVLAEVARLAAIKLAAQIVGALFGAAGGVGKSAGTIGTGTPKLFAAGGIITGPTAVSTAGGGIGIAGEAGPEVVAPLRRDSSGNMGVGAVAPRVTVNNYAGAEVRASQTSDGLQIDIMRRVIADDIRRGGNSVSSAIEGAYRIGRQASAFG